MVDILVKFQGRKARIVARNIPFAEAMKVGNDSVKYHRKAMAYAILPVEN